MSKNWKTPIQYKLFGDKNKIVEILRTMHFSAKPH